MMRSGVNHGAESWRFNSRGFNRKILQSLQNLFFVSKILFFLLVTVFLAPVALKSEILVTYAEKVKLDLFQVLSWF